MVNIFNQLNANSPKIRELDPVSVQRIKEGIFVNRFISESQVAARKCDFYAGISLDPEVKNIFDNEAKLLRKSARLFQQYYESITME